MKKYILYKRPEQYFAAPVGIEPPQPEICERVKTFTVEAPYMLNAAAYAQIYTGLIKLGYQDPVFTMRRLSPQRYMVSQFDGAVTGIWDTHRKTFVD